jgi:hypothetical protein
VRRSLWRLVLALAAAALVPSPAVSAPTESKLARLVARDQQLFAVGWRLATANAPFCESAAPMIGISLLDAGAFADPAAVRRELGLNGDIALGAVAGGSPAEAAGLAAGDTLLAIGSTVLADAHPRSRPAWQRLIAVTGLLDRELAARGSATLTIARSDAPTRTVTVPGVPACPSRFEVLDSGGKAMAEGTRVIFGRDFPGFGYPEPEFAAAVAHELAHNLLRHRLLLDGKGRSLGNVRLTEREADRLMPWLLANAGWDPGAALSFMRRWGPRHGGGLFRKRTHEGWDERAAAIEAEVAAVRGRLAEDGKADWSRHFRREVLD